MDRHRQRAQNRARLAALTRAAYSAGEGVLPVDAAEHDHLAGAAAPDELAPEEIELDRGAVDRRRRRARARWRVGVAPRAALGLVLAVAVVVVVLAVRSLAADGGTPIPDPAPGSASSAGSEDRTADASPGETAGPSPAVPSPTGEVVVHVAGLVASPGVVSLPPSSRVQDALEAAGGALPEADLAALNLARVLVDGEQVYVPAPGEAPPAGAGGAPGAPAAEGGSDGGPVNLNTADLAALDTLPGIGPALAQRIVEWRTANGSFVDVEELTEVSGIGPATLERLRPLVTV
ncbi:competence protein ComEA helix-hairpin-helix repeat protein [Beutenbergia cavernae DSM 12333]|uniref:Competence protein ComEA helix-hairpin-helix repeat protein n=1 Tax=Beutenbergia cavernae (strain ATCC BAA-8 / DSM 12333 / CCUG 43141 / JCM 11478 / NBRC 16432 / NCIMB 13614 / HKI 0122) TaxID=471853 RepID=C5C480_BEUC1|nr:ComEA family DNA-binding protein [Beutenbergia cavernae]ACQ79993.1 competence protein ComEA helix-hairpin-helix repeat protein [Beutenbergia cavernae DSM 12333]